MNGAAIGEGLCVYENGNGETVALRWTGENMTALGVFSGQWVVIGGTGSMIGGGDFVNVTDRATCAAKTTLTSAVSMP